MVCIYGLQYTNFLNLSDKKSVIVSTAIPIHVSGEQEKIKAGPVLTRLPHSSGPRSSIN